MKYGRISSWDALLPNTWGNGPSLRQQWRRGVQRMRDCTTDRAAAHRLRQDQERLTGARRSGQVTCPPHLWAQILTEADFRLGSIPQEEPDGRITFTMSPAELSAMLWCASSMGNATLYQGILTAARAPGDQVLIDLQQDGDARDAHRGDPGTRRPAHLGKSVAMLVPVSEWDTLLPPTWGARPTASQELASLRRLLRDHTSGRAAARECSTAMDQIERHRQTTVVLCSPQRWAALLTAANLRLGTPPQEDPDGRLRFLLRPTELALALYYARIMGDTVLYRTIIEAAGSPVVVDLPGR
ncbi:hypothetical protein [Streptacidiphilus sp. EB103A]|uniref:hypothetical protein n=1 Tax=Streptacidiphilus sp. EB103A TaxID=3156275 RepID=UPI0035176758